MSREHILRVFDFRRCKSCPLWFTTKSNCDRHQIRKHGASASGSAGEDGHGHPKGDGSLSGAPERPFKCGLCLSSCFSSAANLRRHREAKHQGHDGPKISSVEAEEEEEEDDDDDSENYEQEERENEDEERELVHVENGSLVDEDEDEDDPRDEDEEEEEEEEVAVNGEGGGCNPQLPSLKTPRKRSLMDTIAKLSGSAKKKQVCGPR